MGSNRAPSTPKRLLQLLLTSLILLEATSTGHESIHAVFRPPCQPPCTQGYECDTEPKTPVCKFSRTMLIVVVVLATLGIVVILGCVAALIGCYCAAFKQELLQGLLTKLRDKELARKRRKKKLQVKSSTYFEEVVTKKKRPSVGPPESPHPSRSNTCSPKSAPQDSNSNPAPKSHNNS